VLVDYWWAQHSREGDPHDRDLSFRIMSNFAYRLFAHGFSASHVEDAYWKVHVKAARAIANRKMVYGYIHMQAIADPQGNALRYASYTTKPEGIIDYSVLFEYPSSELDSYIRDSADHFAAAIAPHAREMCDNWRAERLVEIEAAEEVRRALVHEMEDVRRRNASRRLTVEIMSEYGRIP
jgi:hypothetical protein